MHLDTDVWPSQLIAAPLLAQYPESHSPGCEPQIIEGALTQGGLELPAEWQVVALGAHPTGRRNQLRNPRRNQHSFHQALRAGRRGPGSQPPPLRRVTSIPDKVPLNRVVEQFFLLACLDFHRFNPGMTFEDVHIEYLFHPRMSPSVRITPPDGALHT